MCGSALPIDGKQQKDEMNLLNANPTIKIPMEAVLALPALKVLQIFRNIPCHYPKEET